jgi:hypothetical protein
MHPTADPPLATPKKRGIRYQRGAYANLKMSEILIIHDFFRQQYGEFRSRKLTWNVYIFLRSTTTFGIGCLHGIYTVGFYCQKSKSMNMH